MISTKVTDGVAEVVMDVPPVNALPVKGWHAVADALTAHGFASHTESRDNGLAIISEQCPFGGAAVQHPVICAVDRGIVKGMLETLYGDTVPETSASRPRGDDICITLV